MRYSYKFNNDKTKKWASLLLATCLEGPDNHYVVDKNTDNVLIENEANNSIKTHFSIIKN
jgi:hypothetical protein